ncbi:MAG: LamG domain-containing protein, partial [Planctomycetota bacterium]
MCKKLIFLISFVAVLGLVGSVSAEEKLWTNDVGDSNWCDGDNWDPTGVPTSADNVDINDTYPGDVNVKCAGAEANNINWDVNGRTFTIEAGASLTVDEIFDWSDGPGPGIVHIYGELICNGDNYSYGSFRGPDDGHGEVYIYEGANVWQGARFRGADDTSGTIDFYIYGGDVNVAGFMLGDNGSGNFYMTGGRMVCRDDEDDSFSIRGRGGAYIEVLIDGGAELIVGGSLRTPQSADASARLTLDDGYIECKEWACAGDDWRLDINEGMLRIKDPVETSTEEIQGYIDANWITGYNETVIPIVTKDGDDIVVTCYFIHLKAYNEEPPDHSVNLCPTGMQLYWEPGEDVNDANGHNVYFGTDYYAVRDANVNIPLGVLVATGQDSNKYPEDGKPLLDLELNTTYYWRVDEVNEAEVDSPWKGGIWEFTTQNGQAYDESPADGYRGLNVDANLLTWTPCCAATGQKLYYGTDFPGNIPLFSDGFEGGIDPNWTYVGWLLHDATADSNYARSGTYSVKAVGAGVKTLTSDDIDATDYANSLRVRFWVRRTEDVNKGDDLKLYYYDGTDYDRVSVNDFNVVALGPNDTWLRFTDIITDSQYLISNFRIQLVADMDAGGTIYVDDVGVRNNWPVDPAWLEADLGPSDNNYPTTLSEFTDYGWRIDTVIDGNVIQGDYWDFTTGFGGSDLLMYYKFDGGSIGSNISTPITDDTTNVTFAKYDGGGSLTYGESNPMIAASDTSADFAPDVGLKRDDLGVNNDLLRLDGWQYTIELWFKVNEGDYDGEDMMLIGKTLSDDWSIMISDLGDDDDFRWYHDDDDVEAGGFMVGNLDEWIHVAAVYDRSLSSQRQKLYINGILEETGNDDDLNPTDNNEPVTIGYEQEDDVNVGAFFNGLIDEV